MTIAGTTGFAKGAAVAGFIAAAAAGAGATLPATAGGCLAAAAFKEAAATAAATIGGDAGTAGDAGEACAGKPLVKGGGGKDGFRTSAAAPLTMLGEAAAEKLSLLVPRTPQRLGTTADWIMSATSAMATNAASLNFAGDWDVFLWRTNRTPNTMDATAIDATPTDTAESLVEAIIHSTVISTHFFSTGSAGGDVVYAASFQNTAGS